MDITNATVCMPGCKPINAECNIRLLSIGFSVLLGRTFHFYSDFNRAFSNQTVDTLIRRRVLRRLIWVCTVCLCPTKKTLGL